MVKLAIIGFGGHVVKNILPALKQLDDVEIEAIYVRDVSKYKELAAQWKVNLASVNTLHRSKANWHYIATPISTHYELAKSALRKGKNVICEKLATPSLDEVGELKEMALNGGLKIFEVCMYRHHKQYEYIQNLIKTKGADVRSAVAKFTIPHLERGNIRYRKDAGGGALFDVGFYPISIIRYLFGDPINVKSIIKSEFGYDVDLSGAALFEYPNHYCVAEWAIGAVYSNELTLNIGGVRYYFDRVFSKPSTLKTEVILTSNDAVETIEIGADDHFKNMFMDYLALRESNLSDYDICAVPKIVEIVNAC